ncbi:MAG: hypothetical protein OEV28_06450 [Nitrospirota bacterium]|nr:hypothetical protein [Nitrospirota bacterium]
MIYRLLKSFFTDRLAYGTAVASAVWWFLDMRYPALLPPLMVEAGPVWSLVVAGLAGGLFIAKHVFITAHLGITRQIAAENSRLETMVEDIQKKVSEARAERDLFSERERFLKDKLRCYEEKGRDQELSVARRRLRVHEEDTRTSVGFLIRDLRERLGDLDFSGQEEMERAVRVLQKELDLLDSEIKLEQKSLFETVLKIAEIRENIFDLTSIGMTMRPVEGEETAHHLFAWMSSKPEEMEHEYKFLKVAFHPDRYPSEALKKKALRYFQQISDTYSTIREKAKA